MGGEGGGMDLKQRRRGDIYREIWRFCLIWNSEDVGLSTCLNSWLPALIEMKTRQIGNQ